jgi:hypothetical protein
MKPAPIHALVLSLLGANACLTVPEVTDPVIGDWDLQDVEGTGICQNVMGTLEIRPDLGGEFEWSADCTDGAQDENWAVLGGEIKDPGREYDFDMDLGATIVDWDCTIGVDGDLNCAQEEPATLFEFTKSDTDE